MYCIVCWFIYMSLYLYLSFFVISIPLVSLSLSLSPIITALPLHKQTNMKAKLHIHLYFEIWAAFLGVGARRTQPKPNICWNSFGPSSIFLAKRIVFICIREASNLDRVQIWLHPHPILLHYHFAPIVSHYVWVSFCSWMLSNMIYDLVRGK